MLVSERRSGPVSRQLLLGDSLDAHGVVADYDRGVLTLHIPVAAAAKPHKVEIGEAPRPSTPRPSARTSSG